MSGPDHPMHALVGRLQELEFLRGFTRQVGVNGGALLLSGDPGVGKTALLEAVAGQAEKSGLMLLRVAGSEFEAEVSFSGLNQALYPLIDAFDDLAPVHASALKVALGFAEGAPPDRLLLSNAVTLLLRTVAARTPLLLIVDDLPWVDRASAAVLSFVARRLIGSRAGLLAAHRTGAVGFLDRSGLPEYQVQPLTRQAAAELLTNRFPDLDPQVMNRVLETAQGNPLAVMELPQALTSAQRAAVEPIPDVLPLGQRLQRIFASRVAALPASTRALLLTVALEGSGDLSVITAAADRQLGELAPAERDHLVHVDPAAQRISFQHPLVRSAVVEYATAVERQQAHQALAEVFSQDLERRAWHLSEACIEPHTEVAALLEKAARKVLERGDAQGAVTMLCRAADLSPSSRDRSRRLAAAALIGAEYLGQPKSAVALLNDIRQDESEQAPSLHYASAAALVLLDSDAHVDTAHQLLVGALESSAQREDVDDEERVDALWALGVVSFIGGRPELWEPFHAGIDRLANPPADLVRVRALFVDPVRRGVAALPELEAALAEAHRESDPDAAENLAGAAFYVDRLAPVREALWRTVRQGRGTGVSRRHLVAIMDLCVDDFHRGLWQEAAELAAEGMRVCEELGDSLFTFYIRYHLALLAAVQGRSDSCRSLAGQMIGWAGPRGVGLAQVFARHALLLAELGAGNWESAYRNAIAISRPGTLDLPHSLWVAMDLIDAAVRTGRRDEAERHVRVLDEMNVAALSPRLAIHVAAAHALIASDDSAPALFDHALSLPTVDQWPFDAARIRLTYGERLRRARATTDARAQLQEALTAFDELGASPWADRAERELRAAGQAGRVATGPLTGPALTPQELEIARLAAQGLTNKEIADRLYLSPRTVGGHLYRIFPKLGITKRAALRDALSAENG